MSKKLDDLETFLRTAQATGSAFTKGDIARATNYRMITIDTYFSKYLLGYLIYTEENDNYLSKGIEKLSSEQFKQHLSQKKVKKNNLPSNVLKLHKRSFDAYCLALESYNRPTLDNRVEAFCILMTNAWELLLKSEIIKLGEYPFSDSKRVIPAKAGIQDSYLDWIPGLSSLARNDTCQ